MDAVFDTVVFSGGGPAGVTFVGCIRYLEHLGIAGAVRTYVGTSAGAIMAVLCASGLTADELQAWLVRHSGDGSSSEGEGGERGGEEGSLTRGRAMGALDPEGLMHFAERLGVDDGEAMLGCIREALVGRGLPPDPTFLEFAKRTGRTVAICASNMSEGRHEYFSVDTHPDMHVLLACRMSYGIPLLFTPVRYKGCVYVDGGLFNNVPVGYVTYASNTLSLVLDVEPLPVAAAKGEDGADDDGMGPCEYLCMLLRAMLTHANRATRPSFCNPSSPSGGGASTSRHVRTVDVTPPKQPCMWTRFSLADFAFRLDKEYMETCIQHGYDALEEALFSATATSAAS